MARKPRSTTTRDRHTPVAVLADDVAYDDEDLDIQSEGDDQTGDLSDLSSPEFQEWEWMIYRLRSSEDMRRASSRNPRIWVAKKFGPISLPDIQLEFGGGWFEFWGKKDGVLMKRIRRELEGDPVIRKAPTSAAAPNGKDNTSLSVPQGTLSVEDQVRRAVARERRRHQHQLERQERDAERARSEERFNRLEQLIAQAATARPVSEAKPERLKDLAETMLMLRQLSPDGTAGLNPLELLQAARDWMNQGIVLGEKREPGSAEGGDGWNAERITAVAQAVAQVLSRFTPPGARRPVAPAQPATPGAPPTESKAEVVTEPVATETQPDNPLHRWQSAVETVSRNMLRGRGPDDTAATIEDLLSEEELNNIRGGQIDGVWRPTAVEALAWLEAQGVGKFPQLESPGGLVYLDSVLAELRKPDDDE